MASSKTKTKAKIPRIVEEVLERWLLEWNTEIGCENYCYPYPSEQEKGRMLAEANIELDARGEKHYDMKRLNEFLQNNRRTGNGCSRMLQKVIKREKGPEVTIQMIRDEYEWDSRKKATNKATQANKTATRSLLNRPKSTSHPMSPSHPELPKSPSQPELRKSPSHQELRKYPSHPQLPKSTSHAERPDLEFPEFALLSDTDVSTGSETEEEEGEEVVGPRQESTSHPELTSSPLFHSTGVGTGLTKEGKRRRS